MNYNIEGLGWPAREGRGPELAEIGRRIADLHKDGQGPDLILLQEVFSGDAAHAVRKMGYPARVAGPKRAARRDLPSDGRVPGHRRWKKGELGIRFASGGLVILSRYPIVGHEAEPFSHRSCAGKDCLSNKGALFARVAIPGVPDPVDVFNTHLNSRTASGTSPRRSLISHKLESRELADFVDSMRDPSHPAVLGGDFNVRHAEERFSAFEEAQSMTLVHRYCLKGSTCDVEMNWEDDQPWLDTQDLQLFEQGARVSIRPIRVRTMFDGGAGGPVLSDHSAFRVVYDLSWKPGTPAGPNACPVQALRFAANG
jgi:endonuclease/exonuclease/phosphatase family metal-dependent hydrolase